jgi:hypothetical protein
LRQDEIQLQVALITPLIHLKGYAAPETKAAAERARLLIEQAEALGEAPEDPLLLFSALYGFWIASYVKFDGDMMLSNARDFLAMAEKQRATVPIMVGHRLMGISLFCTGDIQQGRAHFDRASASYDPARGLNENTNGLIRDFFPKGTDFSTISSAEVAKVERLLNARPRKSLGFRSPQEVFHSLAYS